MAQQTQGLAESLQNLEAGPLSITLEQYRRRNTTCPATAVRQTAKNRGSYRVTTNKAIREFHRLADLPSTYPGGEEAVLESSNRFTSEINGIYSVQKKREQI